MKKDYREWFYMILIPLTTFLWMLGGYAWKWLRRYVIPIIFFVAMLFAGVPILINLLVTVLGGIAFSLPYGENSSWLMRGITACSFGAFSLPLGSTPWQLVPPIIFVLTWIGSNYEKTKKFFQWKICEALTATAIAIKIADLLYHFKG